MRSSIRGIETDVSRELGASVLEYTLMMGIIFTVGITAIKSIGGAVAGSSDPCNPGVLVKAAQMLGDQTALNVKCEHPPVP